MRKQADVRIGFAAVILNRVSKPQQETRQRERDVIPRHGTMAATGMDFFERLNLLRERVSAAAIDRAAA
jgi:hypothetical protein